MTELKRGQLERVVARDLIEVFRRLGLEEPELPDQMEEYEDWSIEPEVVLVLRSIVQNHRPLNVVEVGSLVGSTVLAMANATAEYGGRVYAIEPDDERASEIESRVQDTEYDIQVLRKTSVEAFREWGREAVDLLVIDADHEFVSEYVDIAMWSSLLSPQGWLVIHDTLTRLERRFPEDYFATPFVFDIIDIVGLQTRLSSKPWQGAAFIRWSEFARDHVLQKYAV